jgi:hypothetical protein
MEVVMVDVRHNKGAYRKWYKRKYRKKTHAKGCTVAKITKELQHKSKNKSKLKLRLCVLLKVVPQSPLMQGVCTL